MGSQELNYLPDYSTLLGKLQQIAFVDRLNMSFCGFDQRRRRKIPY